MALDAAEQLIASFESCRLTAYQDVGGRWTIGYGATYLANGSPVKPGTTWTQEQALAALQHTVESVEATVRSLVTARINDNQLAALTSLAYNIGTHALAGSTLLKKLNAGEYEAAADAFQDWDKVAGKVSPGLHNRRVAERAVFLKD